MGLQGDLLNDRDPLFNGLHGLHDLADRRAALLRLFRGFQGDLLRRFRIVRRLPEIRGHLFHRRRTLFGSRRLLTGTLRHLFRAGLQDAPFIRNMIRRRLHLADHVGQRRHHRSKRFGQHPDFIGAAQRNVMRQIPFGDAVRDLRQHRDRLLKRMREQQR